MCIHIYIYIYTYRHTCSLIIMLYCIHLARATIIWYTYKELMHIRMNIYIYMIYINEMYAYTWWYMYIEICIYIQGLLRTPSLCAISYSFATPFSKTMNKLKLKMLCPIGKELVRNQPPGCMRSIRSRDIWRLFWKASPISVASIKRSLILSRNPFLISVLTEINCLQAS